MEKKLMLPAVDFCGLQVSRLVIGANPFGGYSHQTAARNAEMRAYYDTDRIIATWNRAVAVGINTMVTNNETPHVLAAVREYRSTGGTLQWIAQLNCRSNPDMILSIDEAVAIGCSAVYFHGAQVEDLYLKRDASTLRTWCDHARQAGVPAGVAGHAPEAHRWVDTLDTADFHAVCFFNCGSLHDGKGEKFRLGDLAAATECVRAIRKPCIGYKIMGAGRIDPQMAFEYAFESIKPGDIVNVGIYRGDKDDMVEDNAAIVAKLLARDDAHDPPPEGGAE